MVAHELAVRLPDFGDNSYRLHKFIWNALSPHQHVDLGKSFLYRLMGIDGARIALMRFDGRSRSQFVDTLSFQSVACPIVERYQPFKFTVRLCPLIRVNGRAERTPENAISWAHNLLSRNGFNAVSISAGCPEYGFYEKNGCRATRHNTSLFTVATEVADVDLACHAWLYGVGRRKSTGCGMLLEH